MRTKNTGYTTYPPMKCVKCGCEHFFLIKTIPLSLGKKKIYKCQCCGTKYMVKPINSQMLSAIKKDSDRFEIIEGGV